MKQTMWDRLLADDCQVTKLQVGKFTGNVLAIQLRHPLLKKARWFTQSKAGNFYSRYTLSENHSFADGYIIEGKLNTNGCPIQVIE